MKQFFRKTVSGLLALTMACGLVVPAAASDALGDDLTQKEILLNEETQLSTNVFWSSTYSDLRTEHFITYTPNEDVLPVVTAGEVLTGRDTVSKAAARLEEDGYRVVAGINGDFYNVGNGLPIGIVVTEGELRSSDAGYHAVGFMEDGSAVIGKPGVSVSADLGYGVDNGSGYTQIVRKVMGVNKARVSTGGIYLYTYDFNDRHTTGNTESGIDVLCTIEEGRLAIGRQLVLSVDRVMETSSATVMEPDQVVLSVNLKSDSYHVDALRNVPEGTEIVLDITTANEDWEDVEYAIGALYSLVENGEVVSGLAAGANPRTAVGQRPDGSLIFYTIDGRKTGHSIGATLTQVGKRLVELGCETAVCLDGGGSTTLAVTRPGDMTASTVNRPSEGEERSVTNQIFLVADSRGSGRLSHFYVEPESYYVMAGAEMPVSVSAVDTNFIPMEQRYDLWASDGEMDGDVLIAPEYGGEVTITAERKNKEGSATVYVVETPDEIEVRFGETEVESLTLTPGGEAELTASALYNHLPVFAGQEQFRWDFEGSCGTLEGNTFYAGNPGSGVLTVSAGEKTVEIPVTVTKLPLKTVEDFEDGMGTIYSPTPTGALSREWAGKEFAVKGEHALRLDYYLAPASSGGMMDYEIPAGYTALNLWVCGDNSGNLLSFRTEDGEVLEVCTLDFEGWQLCQVELPSGGTRLTAIGIEGQTEQLLNEETGEFVLLNLTPVSGTIYLDQLVATFVGTFDEEVPEIKAELDTENWAVKANVFDEVDGVPAKDAVTVTFNGESENFEYDPETGDVSWYLPGPGEGGGPWRMTVTAKDASGNIGRASVDIPTYGYEQENRAFNDIGGYWAADYVDYLYDAGITTGYADGTFRPDQKITRAQFAVMLYRSLGLNEADYADVVLPFADNAKIGDYAVPAIKALYTEGIINGSTSKDGRLYFNPDSSLTRAQAATMIGRTQEKGYDSVELSFADAAKIPAYATAYIQTMAAQGVISGYADGTFKPNNPITRGQMAKILYTLM